MASPADLHRTIQSTLASKRLGVPVFLRYTFHSPEKPEAIPARLAQYVGLVQTWMGQPLDRIFAVGSPAAGQVSLTLDFRTGASAIITWIGTPGRGMGVDVMLLGNHGALYHDAGQSQLWDESVAVPLDPAPGALVGWVQKALGSGRPEAEGGRP